MIKAVIFDFAKVLLFAKDPEYTGRLNPYWRELSMKPGFKFLDYFRLNEELVGEVQRLKEKGVKVYIFTSETIQEDPAIKGQLGETFDDVFSALRIGKEKTDAEAYKEIARRIRVHPSEILYIDDKDEFVKAARDAGMNAFRYESNKETISNIRKEVHH